jgi:tetratricopeptide (TPR) repeat protein/predicted Ser/Thr protein kinase
LRYAFATREGAVVNEYFAFLLPGGGLQGPLLGELVNELEAAAQTQGNCTEEPDTPAATIGQQIGCFTLARLLGSGGMGSVYLAERNLGDFRQKVALKLIRGDASTVAERDRFNQERQILARLRHPNIAPLLDGGVTDDGRPYFTMEYVDGVPITNYCRDHADGVNERLQLLLQVGSALAYAHQNLVIHRDIKPSNILVTADRRVMLLDFGISKRFDDAAGRTLTQHAIGPMTPEYAAPEQFQGGPVTTATDTYQFGVLMFRLLTGRLPYLADPSNALEWVRAVCEDEPLTLSRALCMEPVDRYAHATLSAEEEAHAKQQRRFARKLGRDLDAIVHKALAKCPERGYRSMDALMGDIEAYLGARPVSARRPGAIYHAGRFVVRHRVAVAITASLIVLLIGTTLSALNQADIANREAVRSTAALDFVAAWFKVADPNSGNGTPITAHTLFAQGAQRLQTALSEQPGVRGRMEHIIGDGFLALGETRDALPHYEKAIDLLRQDSAHDHFALAAVLERAASAAESASRLNDAAEWLHEVDSLTGVDSPATVDIRVNALIDHTAIERNCGNRDRALDYALRALALSERNDRGTISERTARVLRPVAVLLKDGGNDQAALDLMQRSHDAMLSLFGADDLRTIGADEGVGWVLTAMGRFDEAEQKLDAAADKIRRVIGVNTRRYANNLYNRADLYRARGELEQARAAFLEVARIHMDTYSPNPLARGWTLWRVAEIDFQQQRPEKALETLREVERLWTEPMPPDSPVRAELWSDIAKACMDLGRAEEAANYIERALALLRLQTQGHEQLLADLLRRKVSLAPSHAIDDQTSGRFHGAAGIEGIHWKTEIFHAPST